jgi:hypothetical protein
MHTTMKFTRKQVKYGLIGILFVGLIGAGTVIYLFNMPHRDVLSEEAGLQVNAHQLVDEFSLLIPFFFYKSIFFKNNLAPTCKTLFDT